MNVRICLLALATLIPASARPVVFQVSDPILPGQTALLTGDSIGPEVTIEGWQLSTPTPQRLQIFQASDISAKVLVPSAWKPGIYALRLRNATGVSDLVYLNRPRPWWYLAGPDLRVFGKNFAPGLTAALTARGKSIPLTAIKIEPYAIRFALPANLAPGDYQLTIPHAIPLAVHIASPAPKPTARLNVKDFGATGDGLHDDTPAFRDALAKAAATPNTLVLIPAGRYRITGKLVIPPFTTLRGEKRERVWLYVPKETPEFDTVFAGNNDFAIEDLSLVSQTATRLIAAPDVSTTYRKPWGTTPPAGVKATNVRLHRLRLQHLLFAHRVNKGDPRRNLDVGYATIALSGEDLELSDSEVISSGVPIAVHTARRLRIERNRLDTGRNGWYALWNAEETLFEDNLIQGRDLEASYGGFQNKTYRVYFAGNRLQDGYGGEREALTFDTPYAPRWMGRLANPTATTLTTREHDGAEKTWKPNELAGEICLIAYGKGVGQLIPIASNTETTITLERPWAVPPDDTSHLVIRANKSQIVITRNHFSDASAAIQLYSQSYGVIIDGNRAERTGGMYGLSWDFWWTVKNTRRYSTCMFNQWLNNELGEGFIYQQGAWQDGVMGPAAGPRDGRLDPPAIAVLGNVIRNNRLSDHNTLGALLTGRHPTAVEPFGTTGYLGRDTIIEGNTISDTPIAIEIYPGYRDTLVRKNKVAQSPVPLTDDGVNTWLEPGERLRLQTAAARERFPKLPQAPTLWEAVAKAATAPVEPAVAQMLLGLHYERTKTALRLRTEPWAPAVQANQLTLTYAGATLHLRIP